MMIRAVFAIFNPLNFLYLLFNKPIKYTRLRVTLKYYIGIILVWLVLTVFLLLAINFTFDNIHLISGNNFLECLLLLWLIQTTSVVFISLRLGRVYLTKNSLVQTWWFIKIFEVKYENLFAIDVDVQQGKRVLIVYTIDRSLGRAMQRIISDVEAGFYFEADENFIKSIKETIPANYLSDDIQNFPEVKKAYDLDKKLFKYYEYKGSKGKGFDFIAISLLILHPGFIFVLVNFVASFSFSLFVSVVSLSLLDLARDKLLRIFLTCCDKEILDPNISVDKKMEFIDKLTGSS